MYGAVSAATGIATEFVCKMLVKCNTSHKVWQAIVSMFLFSVLIFLYYSNSQYPAVTVLVLVICYMAGEIRRKISAMESIGKFIGLEVLYVAAHLTAECFAEEWKEKLLWSLMLWLLYIIVGAVFVCETIARVNKFATVSIVMLDFGLLVYCTMKI